MASKVSRTNDNISTTIIQQDLIQPPNNICSGKYTETKILVTFHFLLMVAKMCPTENTRIIEIVIARHKEGYKDSGILR